MSKILQKCLFLLALAILICGIIYPILLWGLGKVFFPVQAEGSLILDKQGTIRGSKLIAQAFTQDQYFHPRPSAADYDASASASSALAASNPELRKRVIKAIIEAHPESQENIPADMVTTSASGLDPDITLQNAEYQLKRVANRWAVILNRDPQAVRQEIYILLLKNAHAPLAGLAGEKLVNVLEINWQLQQRYSKT